MLAMRKEKKVPELRLNGCGPGEDDKARIEHHSIRNVREG